MQLDARGLPISTASAKAAAAYDYLVTGYLTQRADTPARLTALLEADPDFALAHCMQGYFAMMAYKQATVPAAIEAARTSLGTLEDGDLRRRAADRRSSRPNVETTSETQDTLRPDRILL
jgi:hypothetical protein